jgi:hypothetical protein
LVGVASGIYERQARWRRIVDQRREAADALPAGTTRQPARQLGAQSSALPLVQDSDGNFGCLGFFGAPDVASCTQATTIGWTQYTKCLGQCWSICVR